MASPGESATTGEGRTASRAARRRGNAEAQPTATGTPGEASPTTPAPRPLTAWSDAELIAAYDQESEAISAEPFMLQVEVSRRASDKVARSLNRLAVLLLVVTCALIALAAVQLVVTLETSKATATSATTSGHAKAPAFERVGIPWFYCSPSVTARGGPHGGPCTVGAIFRSTGGPGTELVTYTTKLSKPQSCLAIIPSTPSGSDSQAVCIMPNYIQPGTQIRARLHTRP